ncbi:MAG: glycosyltransferase family 39 protein, partial [Dysgonamonadaceae bacterium]|nr:glycosyltransferase family 39 protein [Dysgonamonadaceae bacterium]MDD4606421.1 glycosyltransferase family 39 protein [Dysgonamonadaceae bacterium]
MKNKQIYLILIWFIALLPIMIMRDFTPNNELRYLSIVDEALVNGDVFTFTNQGEIYADKPPLHFWLMMLGKVLLNGHRMWYLSMLSFIPALITLVTMTKWMRMSNREKEISENEENENAGILMLMTSGLFIGLTIFVRMDMLMVMFITLSLYTFYKIYKRENHPRDTYLFPIYVFLALFSKGPIGILIPLISTTLFLIFRKKIHTFKKYWGWKSLLIILAGVIIWFTGVYIEGGNEYLNNLLVHQTVERGINSYHHKEPFYYYAISIWYSIAPWSLLAIGLLVASLYKRKIKSDIELFFAIIVLSSFGFLSIISSKIEIYFLPAIPSFIFLTALLLKHFNIQNKWIRASLAIPAMSLVTALPVIVYLSNMNKTAYLAMPLIYIAATILTITGLVIIFFLYRKRETYKAIYSMSLGLLLSIFVLGCTMPQLNNQLGWRNLCTKAMELTKERNISDYYIYEISRAENMDVYLKKDVHVVTKEMIVENMLKNKLLLLPIKQVKNDNDILSVIKTKEHYQIG